MEVRLQQLVDIINNIVNKTDDKYFCFRVVI